MEPHQASSLRDAAFTMAAVFLAFAALDDITTDDDTSFLVERLALAGCTIWFGVVARRLVRDGSRAFGRASLASMAMIGAAAQWIVGSGTPLGLPAYFATVSWLAWFLVVAGMLAVRAMRSPPRAARAA